MALSAETSGIPLSLTLALYCFLVAPNAFVAEVFSVGHFVFFLVFKMFLYNVIVSPCVKKQLYMFCCYS